MVAVELLAFKDVKIAFSPTGHGLMTLIISYLVVAKVNLSYDRYMDARHSIGHALSALRELNQLAMMYTVINCETAILWRSQVGWHHIGPSNIRCLSDVLNTRDPLL